VRGKAPMAAAHFYNSIAMLFNYKNLSVKVQSLLCCFVFLVSAAFNTAAQTPIAPTTWTGSPASAAGPSAFTTLPATTTPGAAVVYISQWNRSAVNFNAAAACYNSRDWEVGGSLASAQANSKFIFFTVTNNATTELQITRLYIMSQVSATGPQKVQVQYTLGSVTADFGPPIVTIHTASPENWNLVDNVCVGPGQTITFKLYGWGGTNIAGTLRINDGTAIGAGFATPVTATATNTSPICSGTTLDFGGVVSGGIPGYTYSWSGPGGFSSTLLSPSIPAAPVGAAGVYTLTVTDMLGCTTATTPVTTTVTVNTAPAAITGTLEVCPGLTTSLSSTSMGGTWSSGDIAIATVNASTGVVTGIATGTAAITYMLSSSCETSAIVTVNAPAPAIAGTLAMCQGTTTTLTNVAAGTWSSSDLTVATINASGVVAGITPGTATITFTVPSGCISTATVTVNSIPAAITGPVGVCLNATATLSNATAGGTWISSNTAVATIGNATGTVGGISLGTATITYRITATGCFITRVQTVNPLPAAIAGPSTVCPGLTINLTSAPGGGNWTSSDITRATAAAGTGIVTGVAAGTANITYTLTTGCIATREITINPAPPAIITPIGDTVFCPGGFVALTANTGAGLSYQWISGATPIPGATSATYVATATGSYIVRVTNGIGCPWSSSPMSVLVNTVAATITVPGGTLTDCAATPVVLNAVTAPGLTYQWILDGTAIPGATATTHAAGITGNYTLLVTNTTGCTDISSPLFVTIHPSPSATVSASGPLTFCTGSNVVIVADSGPGYTYQWFNGAAPIPGATSLSYMATASGNYHVFITNGYGCNMTSTNSNVVVKPIPNVAITPGGPKVFCAGGGVFLDAAPGAGYAYQWYKNGAPIAGATNMTYYANTTGGYRVKVTDVPGGCADMTHADTVVTLVNTPTILTLTPATFCWGGSALLSTTASTLGYLLGYQWFFNGTPIPGATTNTYSAGTTGNYSCKVTVPGGCVTTTLPATVTEKPLPDPIITFNGTTLKTASFYTTYQWYKNLVPISGATAFSTVHLGPGNYKVRVTDTNSCQAFSSTYVLNGVSNPTSISFTATDNIRIYPNPVQHVLNIECPEHTTAVLTAIDGRKIIEKSDAKSLDISSLSDGIYILTLFDENSNPLRIERIIKAKN
jgi:trimeric autotransporter adhesin